MAGKVLGHGRDPAPTALMNSFDVGPAHLSYPPRIAAKGPRADVALAAGLGIIQYVHNRAQQQVDAHGGQFKSSDLSHSIGVGQIPGSADGHGVR